MIAGFNIKTIDETEIKNQKVLVRVDFDVAMKSDYTIADDTRIQQTLPTLNYLLQNNNKLILVSKLNRPKTRDAEHSLKPVAERLQKYFPQHKVVLVSDFLNDDAALKNQKNGEIILLENIRFYPQEKKNDSEFAKKLSALASIFVLDAFAMLHRSEASVTGVPNYLPSYAGFLVKKEVEMLAQVTQNPQHPLIAILAGSKISTKIGLISTLMKMADYILVGGGIANTFFMAKGYEVGTSLVEHEAIDMAKQMLVDFDTSKCKLVLPTDVICGDLQNESIKSEAQTISNIPKNLAIFDIGPETEKEFTSVIKKGKTIVWNGPVGMFENPRYRHGTDAIYDSIVSLENTVTIVGGGDTLAAIAGKNNNDKITHISTGGGAMLEFIEKGTLPGIEAIENVKRNM